MAPAAVVEASLDLPVQAEDDHLPAAQEGDVVVVVKEQHVRSSVRGEHVLAEKGRLVGLAQEAQHRRGDIELADRRVHPLRLQAAGGENQERHLVAVERDLGGAINPRAMIGNHHEDGVAEPGVAGGLLAVSSLPAPARAAQGAPDREPAATFAGMSLYDALQLLRARGLPVFFSSNLIRDSMRVTAEPRGSSPREILDALLRPHGLRAEEAVRGRLVVVAAELAGPGIRGRVLARGGGPLAGVRIVVLGASIEATTDAGGRFRIPGLGEGSYTLEAHLPRFFSGRWAGIEAVAGRDAELILELEPAPVIRDEIDVAPSRYSMTHGEPVTVLALGQADAALLPHLGNDPFRAIDLLPGTAGRETSSRLHIRGGRDDEVLVALDGLELVAPFHLQDFESALSIVPPASIERVDLMTGGYPVEYGDRSSGVLAMTTVTPTEPRGFHLGLGSLVTEMGGSGRFDGDRGSWVAAARAGSYELALEIRGREAAPRFWDAFGKLGYRFEAGQDLQLHLLLGDDEFELDDSEEVGESYTNHWGNRYLWLTHGAVVRSDLFVETIGSFGRVDRDRSATGAGGDSRFEVRDARDLDVFGLEQDWIFQPSARTSLKAGWSLRRFDSAVDYFNDLGLHGPLTPLRSRPGVGSTISRQRFDTRQAGAYVSSRWRPRETLTLELGLRRDLNSLPREDQLGPRLNLAWTPTKRSVWRLAWGRFLQSQRPYELQVEDGLTELARSESVEQRIVGFERLGDRGATLRIEAYQRRMDRSRARFVNLFDSDQVFPELAQDRVLVEPDGGRAEGIELFYRGADRGRLHWWLSYALSSVADQIDGLRVPRAIDQTHAFRSDVNYRAKRGWNFNLAWVYHTGWPITEVSAEVVRAPDGSTAVEPVLGDLRRDRLPDYHRLDLRVSREWVLGRGRLGVYLDLQNLYSRKNVRAFDDFTLERDGEGGALVRSETVSWGGFFPSFGIRWRL